MNRRDLIKGIVAFWAINPMGLFAKSHHNKALHFVGLGDAGCNTLEFIHKKGVKAKYTYITEERDDLPQHSDFVKFTFASTSSNEVFLDYNSITSKIKAVLNEDYNRVPSIIKEGFNKENNPIPSNIREVFNDGCKYVLVSGLGGRTGTYLTETLTLFLDERNSDFLTICTLPPFFDFEGTRKKTRCYQTFRKLESIQKFKCYDLQNLREIYGNMKISRAFELGDEALFQLFKESTVKS